jgi:acyl carrier protein
MMLTVFDRVQAVITKKFSVPAENIRLDSTLESLGLDSLDLIDALFEIEDEFNVRLPQDASGVRTATIRDVVESIEKLQAADAGEQAAGA